MVDNLPNGQLSEWFNEQLTLLGSALREGNNDEAARILAKTAHKYSVGVAERLHSQAVAQIDGENQKPNLNIE